MSGFGYNVLGFGAFPNRSVEAGITGNATNVSAKAQFNATIWASGTPKILNISSGVTLGGTSGTAALTIESDLGGSLLINNAGTITGTGGAAGTSGAGGNGGNAILNSGGTIVSLVNSGTISGGGGGGGKGGTGGNGSYSQTLGPSYTASFHTMWYIDQFARTKVYWSGSQVGNILSYTSGVTSVSYGGYTYTKGTYVQSVSCGNDDNCATHRVSRTGSVSTSGGAGGNGGAGAGYSQSQANGSSGASGGTNAGAGGTGGNGGALGSDGAAGATGANGNSTNGGSGSAAGTAGKAVSGAVNFTDASGTTNGTVDST